MSIKLVSILVQVEALPIHSSSAAYPSLNRDTDLPLPSNSSPGDAEVFPSHPRDIIFPECPGSTSQLPARRKCLKQLTYEAPRRDPSKMAEPLQEAPFHVEE